MSNPFEALNIQDDDEETTYIKAEDKHKRTQQEKKQYKKQQEAQPPKSNQPVEGNVLPSHIKEDLNVGRRIREQRPPKDIGSGHYHDRRSGTGRVDRPRKEGGGYGNVGNAKDEVRQEKYIKPTGESEEQPVQAEVASEEKKPEEPQAVTLDEYYRTKGVELTYNIEKKGPPKKGDINAEWIKKEKLTLLQTKEDKKIQEQESVQNKKKVRKVEKEEEEDKNQIAVGFGQKSVPARKEQSRVRNEKGGKKGKASLDDDFPAL